MWFMARLTPQQLEDELKKQNKIYGDGDDQLGGSATNPDEDDDLDDAMEEAFGEEPKPGEPVDIAEKVDEDESALKDLPFAEEEDE